jgi:hypothetical protein
MSIFSFYGAEGLTEDFGAFADGSTDEIRHPEDDRVRAEGSEVKRHGLPADVALLHLLLDDKLRALGRCLLAFVLLVLQILFEFNGFGLGCA